MYHGIEKRRCRRFEIPGAEAKYKKTGLLALFFNGFSEPHPVINVSKGGLAFVCDKKLSKGKKLVVQLMVPDKIFLNLNAVVRRQEITVGSDRRLTGVEFMPFGGRNVWNTRESLDVLRKLDEKHGND
jgi:hypothetical protein